MQGDKRGRKGEFNPSTQPIQGMKAFQFPGAAHDFQEAPPVKIAGKHQEKQPPPPPPTSSHVTADVTSQHANSALHSAFPWKHVMWRLQGAVLTRSEVTASCGLDAARPRRGWWTRPCLSRAAVPGPRLETQNLLRIIFIPFFFLSPTTIARKGPSWLT